MRVELASEWNAEKFASYGPAITAAMHKLQERFPRQVRVEHLASEIIAGNSQIWLILDDDDEFISFVLTEIHTSHATGLKTLRIPSFAGEEGASTVHLIGKIEDWAREQGCDEVLIYGRYGWKRAVAAQGYTTEIAVFQKAL